MAGFFSAYSMPQAIKQIESATRSAGSGKVWDRRSPADLLYFFEKLEELFGAVFIIIDSRNKKQEAILEENNGEEVWLLTRYETYCGRHRDSTPWDFFPRHLSHQEFLNPYRALKKVMYYKRHEEWKDILKTILQHALSPNSIYEFDDGIDLLKIWLLLHKLIEASHLLQTRILLKG